MWALVPLGLLSLACLVHLWFRPNVSIARRLLWSVIMMAPVVGPLMYGSVFRPLGPGKFRSTRDGIADAIGANHPGQR